MNPLLCTANAEAATLAADAIDYLNDLKPHVTRYIDAGDLASLDSILSEMLREIRTLATYAGVEIYATHAYRKYKLRLDDRNGHTLKIETDYNHKIDLWRNPNNTNPKG